MTSFHLQCVTNIIKDFKSVFELLQEKSTDFFGQVTRRCYNAKQFFHGSGLVRYLIRESRESVFIVGYAELTRFPPIGALLPDCWMYWLNHHYCTNAAMQITRTNTVFFHRFIFNKDLNPQLLLCMVTECFLRDFKIRNIIVVQMPSDDTLKQEDTPNYDILQNYSTILYPRNFSVQQCKNVQRLHVIQRNTVADKLRYRRALPEDNDDIVEVIDMERPDLREIYGDYYVAEELLKEQDEKDEHNVFIIAEMNHSTVGFIWLNDNVDILTLVENYECECFGNLIKFNRNEAYVDRKIAVSGMEKKPNFKLFTDEVVEELYTTEMDRHRKSIVRTETCNRPCCYMSDTYNAQCHRGNKREQKESAALSTKNEYFCLREEFLRKMQILNEFLFSTAYYHIIFNKKLRIFYNVPENLSEENLSENTPDMYSNVFAIQLLGLHKSMDKRYVYRFISTAFTAFPQHDYCIIALPHTADITPSLRFIFKHFITLVPRPKANIDDTVYIIHRSTVFGDISLHNVRHEDLPYIENILIQSQYLLNKRMSNYMELFNSHASIVPPTLLGESCIVREVLSEVLENPFSEYKFLTIRCGNSVRTVEENVIVGFVIVRAFKEVQKLSKRFLMPPRGNVGPMERGELVLLRLHPNYYWESDSIFRQLACATGFWEFYYILSTALSKHKSLTNDLICYMQPIEPRPIKQFHLHVESTNTAPQPNEKPPITKQLNLATATYAVFYTNVNISKFYGNAESIIVVGFNYMSRALLRLLVFNFKNSASAACHCCLPRLRILVVSRPGVVEAAYDSDFLCNVCENQYNCWINFQNVNSFIRDTTQRMDLRKWMKFISSKLKFINRKNKTILLENGCELHYSKLILSPAMRFGVPVLMRHEPLPPNYAQVNSRLDKILLYHKIMAINNDRNKNDDINIIVYGTHINAFECINFLLNHKVPAKFITLILQYDSSDRDVHLNFNISTGDANIEVILQEMLEDLGVTVKEHLTAKRWKRYYSDDNISHVVFSHFPDDAEFMLPCDLFISFSQHFLNIDFYEVLKKSDITMKNYFIMVNEDFQTNDKDIYAIGACTEPIDIPNHQYRFLSYAEIAEKLIYSLKMNLDKVQNVDKKYWRPVYFQAQLPLGYYMVKVVLPKRYLANHLSNEYGHSMVTYDGNFSRVRLNQHGIVEEIVCVTKKRRELDHLQHFIGLHETLLNDLHSRWYLGEIKSFVDFFEEPWTELIMHPSFDDLRNKIKIIAVDTANDIMNTHAEMERNARKALMKRYMSDMNYTATVEKAFIAFLRQHREDFVHPFAMPEDFDHL